MWSLARILNGGFSGAIFILMVGVNCYATVQTEESRVFSITVGQEIKCTGDKFISERLALRLGFEAMSGDPAAASNNLRCVLSLWPYKYGENGIKTASGDEMLMDILSPTLLALLEADPPVFLDEMSRHSALLDDWLSGLDVGAFTWEASGPCKLEARRKRIIVLLENEVATTNTKKVRERVLSRLREIRCHVID